MTEAPALPPIETPTRPAWEPQIANPEQAVEQLQAVRSVTAGIREAGETVTALSLQRGRLIIDLRTAGVTARAIGDAMGVTEQTVFKLYRDAREAAAAGKL